MKATFRFLDRISFVTGCASGWLVSRIASNDEIL